jgi:hypothetical protein
MKITDIKTSCQPSVGRCKRPGIKVLSTGLLSAAAGAWLLLVEVGVGIGGGIEDPYEVPILAGFFKSVPCLQRHRVEANSTLCAPCYGYHPTCWRQWPGNCVGCPPPPVPGPTQLPAAPLPPELLPTPGATPALPGVRAPTMWFQPLPSSEKAIPPAPMIGSRQISPAESTTLPPAARPEIGARFNPHFGILQAQPGNPRVTRLPDVRPNVARRSAALPKLAESSEEDLDVAPMPPELRRR